MFKVSEGAWFEYVPGKPEEGRIKLRLISGTEDRKIVQSATIDDVDYKSDGEGGDLQRFPFTVRDDDQIADDRIVASIVEWEHTGINGEELKCTRKNKLLMFYDVAAFRAFYVKRITKMRADNNKMYGTEDETGN